MGQRVDKCCKIEQEFGVYQLMRGIEWLITLQLSGQMQRGTR